MRANGYKCYQTKCGCCIGNVCAEPFDIALGCSSRLVKPQTNADRIRAMSDEELAAFMFSMVDCVSCENKLMNNGKLVFGDWAISIRGGWIVDKKGCIEFIERLCKDLWEGGY